jgi:hypothetical protein
MSYSFLSIDTYPILELKRAYETDIIESLFQPEDYLEENRSYSAMNRLFWGDTFADEPGGFLFRGFRQTAGICRTRLEIFGMNYKTAKQDFENARITAGDEMLLSFPIERIGYSRYLKEVAAILREKAKRYNEIGTNLRDILIQFDLSIGTQKLVAHMYSILSIVNPDAIVEYDLTSVLDKSLTEGELQFTGEKIIVLTEGKTDIEFIRGSLKLLYPELFPYYHFIDFEEYKVESNASYLSKLIMSFAASNIKHPIIALFDNDTVGLMEMVRLKNIRLPPRVRVIRFPDLQIAKKYPTKGPTGRKKMNVNGSACGIEMYLGKDVLETKGSMIPIQWKTYFEKENKYQGEIGNKGEIQDKFRLKLKNGIGDFEDIKSVLKSIFGAFN